MVRHHDLLNGWARTTGPAAVLLGVLLLIPAAGVHAMLAPESRSHTPSLVATETDPDEVVRQALADLGHLERCLQVGESEPDSRAGGVELQRLRTLYVLSVEDKGRLQEARAVRARLAEGTRSSEDAALLEAYAGALEMLEAKHGFWPTTRMKHLRRGLAVLDEEVQRRPRNVEIRYLRLVSTAYLPGVLGRGDSVREDRAVLARLLPDAVEAYPMRTFDAMVSTLLDLLPGDDPQRGELEAAHDRALALRLPLAPGCSGS